MAQINLSRTVADQTTEEGESHGSGNSGSVSPGPIVGLRMRWVEKAVQSNRIVLYLAGITLALSAVAGFLMRWVEPEVFPTVGTGVWWAIVTFCTVGYGDVVPESALGRIVASFVMVFAITFIAIATALVTSALVTRRAAPPAGGARRAGLPGAGSLQRIERRLEALERKLG